MPPNCERKQQPARWMEGEVSGKQRVTGLSMPTHTASYCRWMEGEVSGKQRVTGLSMPPHTASYCRSTEGEVSDVLWEGSYSDTRPRRS